MKLKNCHDCGVKPGQPHESGCDVERCSVCGGQLLRCGHKKNDKQFSRWTGIWPGEAEADYLGVDLNQFYEQGYYEIFFVKPQENSVKGFDVRPDCVKGEPAVRPVIECPELPRTTLKKVFKKREKTVG